VKVPELGDQMALKSSAALEQDSRGPLEVRAENGIVGIRLQHRNHQSWS